jgi:predicted DNA-binding transcriptional regulator AlpA
MPNKSSESAFKKSLSMTPFPTEGLVRVSQIVRFLPISKCTWWNGVRAGRYPKPIKLGPNTTAWRAQDIRALAEPSIENTPGVE